MQKNSYFQNALANFTFEAASGGAIRHLTDLGYTVAQIRERLDYPVSYERVQKAVWERLVDTGVILLEEPGRAVRKKQTVYVREYDKYGKASFRLVSEEGSGPDASAAFRLPESRGAEEPCWKTRLFAGESRISSGGFCTLLRSEMEENGEGGVYAACDFGLTAKKDAAGYQEMLEILDRGQREYIAGLPWVEKRVYYRLDIRMLEILARLYGSGKYHGECYLLKKREKCVMEFGA